MTPTDKPNPTCEWVAEHVDEYVEGLLEGPESAKLDRHCKDCPGCAYELELAKAVADGLAELPMLACPDEVTTRLFETIAESSRAELRSTPAWLTVIRPIWRPVSVAAAVAAVVLMALFVAVDTDSDPGKPGRAEVERALQEAKYAFAVISDVGRQTGRQVGEEVQTAVVEPVRYILDTDVDQNGI